MEGPGADSEEKRVLASDLDTVMVDSLKALDLIRPIREADISAAPITFCAADTAAHPPTAPTRSKRQLLRNRKYAWHRPRYPGIINQAGRRI